MCWTFEEDLRRYISRGRRSTRDTGVRSGFAKIILHGRCSTSYNLTSLFHGRRNTLDIWTGKIAKRIGTRPTALHSTVHFCRKSRSIASFSSLQIDRQLQLHYATLQLSLQLQLQFELQLQFQLSYDCNYHYHYTTTSTTTSTSTTLQLPLPLPLYYNYHYPYQYRYTTTSTST